MINAEVFAFLFLFAYVSRKLTISYKNLCGHQQRSQAIAI